MLQNFKNLPWQKILIGFLLTGICALGFLITYLTLKMSKVFVKNPFSLPTPNAYSEISPKPIDESNKEEKGVYNILLLGHGGGNHDGSSLTDSIIVAHVDTNKHEVSFISIPRDLEFNGRKINTEGSINGYNNVGSAITTITGLSINYYVSIDFGGFEKMINALDGIIANVPKTFDDPFYPIKGEENNTCGKTESEIWELKNKYSGYNLETQFTCRYEQLHFDKGQVNLNGPTALKFVRSRHGDSDFGRSARQFEVLKGIASKLVSFKIAGRFDEIVNTISQMVRTDLDLGTIKSLVQVVGDSTSYSYKEIQLTTDNTLREGKSKEGAYILVPKAGSSNYSEIKSFISENIN